MPLRFKVYFISSNVTYCLHTKNVYKLFKKKACKMTRRLCLQILLHIYDLLSTIQRAFATDLELLQTSVSQRMALVEALKERNRSSVIKGHQSIRLRNETCRFASNQIIICFLFILWFWLIKQRLT